MILFYGVKFGCDLCGVEGQIATGYPPEAIRYDTLPLPDGWVSLGLNSLNLTGPMGNQIGQLCQVCGALTVAELGARLKAKWDREKVRL